MRSRMFILANWFWFAFYESLRYVSLHLKAWTSSNKYFQISWPIWILQLWLNASFVPYIEVVFLPDMARQVKDTKIDLLSVEDDNLSTEEAFQKYFFMCMNCIKFVSFMATFINRSCDPYWFRIEFPTSSPENKSEAFDIWVAFFKPLVMLTQISIGKVGQRSCAFFCQFFIRFLFAKELEVCFLIPYWRRKLQGVCRFSCQQSDWPEPLQIWASFFCTKELKEWWTTYYHIVVVDHSTVLQRLIDDLSSL